MKLLLLNLIFSKRAFNNTTNSPSSKVGFETLFSAFLTKDLKKKKGKQLYPQNLPLEQSNLLYHIRIPALTLAYDHPFSLHGFLELPSNARIEKKEQVFTVRPATYALKTNHPNFKYLLKEKLMLGDQNLKHLQRDSTKPSASSSKKHPINAVLTRKNNKSKLPTTDVSKQAKKLKVKNRTAKALPIHKTKPSKISTSEARGEKDLKGVIRSSINNNVVRLLRVERNALNNTPKEVQRSSNVDDSPYSPNQGLQVTSSHVSNANSALSKQDLTNGSSKDVPTNPTQSDSDFIVHYEDAHLSLKLGIQGKIINLNLVSQVPLPPSLAEEISSIIKNYGYSPGRITFRNKKTNYQTDEAIERKVEIRV